MVLGLRDILDAPATVRRRWRLEGALEAVESYFEDVLVYGSQDVFDVAEQYAWPASIRGRLRYCGYVCAPAPAPAADTVRRRHLAEHANSRLLVAMAGGGADGFELFETLLRAFPTGRRPSSPASSSSSPVPSSPRPNAGVCSSSPSGCRSASSPRWTTP